ncbi:hypothetical protein C3Y87_10375 [Carbonactinospora thermoautotrophica]|uniref:Uncharacterized protein n=1 Tax=Carbonactinospora thermoautotrophica TaxID=1469144 RepID=A0A132MQC4_9ACTN|nr:hypothetical protein [Carbonactinospora thermoautotrophica]KWW99621.1 hypothetical protein LI90_1257 [Carbonactinospora thermoautotrophica]KWX04002.1 hypothetical protein TH66_08590 [Carbonactinospora thermoautotrophica]MCX9191812.1 hypothetical protein [Carbonactinospora thermoautotrophica]
MTTPLPGGAACARLSGWSRHLDPADNPGLGETWQLRDPRHPRLAARPALAFAAIGFAGYARGRRAGRERGKCVLRDTRARVPRGGRPARRVALGVSVTRLVG